MAADGTGSHESILGLGALDLRDQLNSGALRVTEVAEATLAAIETKEPDIGAWAWLDGDFVMRQARALEDLRATGRPMGPLFGLPVGVKDIIDTAGLPTENGTVLDAGRTPAKDAFLVAQLRRAGAMITGKTVTTELAFFAPGKTRNPRNTDHSPGGSSQGSAAAVAARMVPLAVGSQTSGSVIRPAAFCGIVGFKPSFGAIPRTGVLSQSPSLDTVGVFANSVEDAALIADCMFGYDSGDPDSLLQPAPRLLDVAQSEPPVMPALAFVRQPAWDDADSDTHAAFAELIDVLGEQCDEVELPEAFAAARSQHEIVNLAEIAKNYHAYEARGRDRLSSQMQAALDKGKAITARDYLAARDWPTVLNAGLEAIFDRYDAVLTPAAPGPAPKGLDSTGNPAFNVIWTFCGTPAITLPLLSAGNGMPMGVQLVGRRGEDGRLLRTARWLAARLVESH